MQTVMLPAKYLPSKNTKTLQCISSEFASTMRRCLKQRLELPRLQVHHTIGTMHRVVHTGGFSCWAPFDVVAEFLSTLNEAVIPNTMNLQLIIMNHYLLHSFLIKKHHNQIFCFESDHCSRPKAPEMCRDVM